MHVLLFINFLPFLSLLYVELDLCCDWSIRLLHTTAKHLIGCDKHDTDDESDREGADQTLPYACLLHMLGRTFC